MEVKMLHQERRAGAWFTTYEDSNELNVYRNLSAALIAKKLNKCGYIGSIKRVQKYTHVEIITNFTDGTRAVYIVPAHF